MPDNDGAVIVSPRALTAEENAAKDAELRVEITNKLERIAKSVGCCKVGNDHQDHEVVQELDKVNQLLGIVANAVELGIANCRACGGTKWHAEEGDCPYDGDRQWFYRRTWPQLVDLPVQ